MTDLPPLPDYWYHTVDLPSGRTPGLIELDRVRDAIRWPDLRGKRCLDLATFDGYWAFEMEKRGAAEVVALDLPASIELDWAPRHRHEAHDVDTSAGFLHARVALGSKVKRVTGNIYTASAEEFGRFDVVLLGAVLLHLRSPFAALEQARKLCDETFISVEPVDPPASLLMPRRAAMVIEDPNSPWTWAMPNRAGHRAMLRHAGFDVETQTHSIMDFGARMDDTHQRRRALRLSRRVARRLARLPDVPGLWTSMIVSSPNAEVAAGDHLPVARRRFA